jgi:hypothetical protein
MGIFGKLAFWKKEDDFDIDSIAAKEMGSGQELFKGDNLGLDEKPISQEKDLFAMPKDTEQPQTFDSPTQQQPIGGIEQLRQQNQEMRQQRAVAGISARDVDLLSSKLDTIKALLNSMDQRIANLERSSLPKKQDKLW